VDSFFDELGHRGYEPLLRKASGRIQFEVVDGPRIEPWLLVVDNGALEVKREAGRADCTVRGESSVFEELVSGRKNVTAAVLRGALICRGNLELLFAIQRLFPEPPRGWDPTADTRSA
jgi:hypothetical protein